jgi:D-alanyl-lipoteichoic acid acyltransferase DltB (MBOAT superfamily)
MPLDDHAWIFMPPTAILSVLTFTAYFAYRIYCLVIAQQTIQPANALGLAWFFLAIEFLIFGTYSYLLDEVKPDRT